MRTDALRRWAGGTMAAALVLGVLAALLAAQPAQARIVTVSFSFEQMTPGERRAQSELLTLPRDARLVDVTIEEETSTPGSFRWEVELCPTSGTCIPVVEASEGWRVSAGDLELGVAVTLDDDAPALASSSISGRLVFAADDVDDDGAPGDGRTLDDDELTGTDEDR